MTEKTLHTSAMLDIESMSLHPGAALVLSLGVVPFTLAPAQPVVGQDRLLIVFDLASQLVAGRRVDAGTQAFWGRQPREASAHFANPLFLAPIGTRVIRDVALSDLGQHLGGFLRETCTQDVEVYSQGIAFDVSNLVAAMMDAQDAIPWKYDHVVDARSLRRKLPKRRSLTTPLDLPAKAHDPIHDSLKQIVGLWEVATDDMLGVGPSPTTSAAA